MNVAVIGASGFVGGHVVRYLRAAGDSVRPIVRNPRALAHDPDRRVADALDVYAVRSAISGCDSLVLSIVGPPEVIVGSIQPVYAAAQAMGIRRMVYISTGVVHGQTPAPGTDETNPLHVRHAFPYNNAKVRAERKLLRARHRGTVEIVMLRPTIVFGPRSRWIVEFASALKTGSAYLIDEGRGICNSIFVDNLAQGVRRALLADSRVDGEAFLLGDAETVTWRELYRPLTEGLGFDFDRIPSFEPPGMKPSFRQLYVDPIRTSEWGEVISARLPRQLKSAAKRALRLCHSPSMAHASAPHDADPHVTVSDEILSLQRCRWRLPHTKAATLMGYVPPVSFADGCARSLEWLQAGHLLH